jgi:hypothetical protein
MVVRIRFQSKPVWRQKDENSVRDGVADVEGESSQLVLKSEWLSVFVSRVQAVAGRTVTQGADPDLKSPIIVLLLHNTYVNGNL